MEKGAINRPASQTQSEQTSTSDLRTALPQPLSPGDVAGPSARSESEQQTLTDIRDAIAECDTLRLDPSLPEADRRDMDAAVLTLRNLERELIEATSETLLDRLEAASKPLEDLARDIRTRVTAMNAPAKALEHFKRLASLATRILREVGRW